MFFFSWWREAPLGGGGDSLEVRGLERRGRTFQVPQVRRDEAKKEAWAGWQRPVVFEGGGQEGPL